MKKFTEIDPNDPKTFMPRYRPSIQRLKEDYSRMIRQRVMARKQLEKRGGVPIEKSKITDNSVPWFTEWPPSLAALLQTNHEIWKLKAYLNNRESTDSARS